MTEPLRGGLVVVDKPDGWTSHDVVARVRRLAGTRKVGHAGTLDPMATGVLVLGVGRATRLLGHLQLADKEYLATIRLGESTTTDDAEGEILEQRATADLAPEQVAEAMTAFVGDIAQRPSSVSAIKVDGRRAYARVRAGEDVELPARPVHVATFELLQARGDAATLDVDVRVICSSGTYVRALARDLGETLDVGGHLTSLRRTRVGGMTLEHAETLEELADDFRVVDLDVAARASFTGLDLDDDQATEVGYGRALPDVTLPATAGDQPVALFAPDGTFLALYEQRGSAARAVAVFV